MPAKPRNSGKPWTAAEKDRLRELAALNLGAPAIARRMGRSEACIWTRACEIGLSLRIRPRSE